MERASRSLAVEHATVPYVRRDGQVTARDWDDLTAGELTVPTLLDETGVSVGHTPVSTATGEDGSWGDSPDLGMLTCEGWMSSANPPGSHRARGLATDTLAWSLCASSTEASCGELWAPLLLRAGPVIPPESSDSRAFSR